MLLKNSQAQEYGGKLSGRCTATDYDKILFLCKKLNGQVIANHGSIELPDRVYIFDPSYRLRKIIDKEASE